MGKALHYELSLLTTDRVCAWLQEVEVKPQPQRSRRGRRRKCDESSSGGAGPGLFLYNNTGAEGQADRTVISLQGAKAKTLPASLGLEELAGGPVRWAGAMISEARNLRQAGPMD